MDGITKTKRVVDGLKKISNSSLLNTKAIDFLRSMKEEIEDMNTKQLLEGKQPNGSNISPDYISESYARLKQSISPNSQRGKYTPNLKLTGSFHKSITVVFKSDSMEIIATDEKSKSLLRKYGSVLGISEQNNKIILEDIRKYLYVFIITTLKLFRYE